MICRPAIEWNGLKMRKISQLFKRADVARKVTHGPAHLAGDHGLAATQLDKIAAGGGKGALSGNPVED
jgi:hypothetical protein